MSWIGGVVLIVLGVLGTVLPWLPGAPLVLAGLTLLAWSDGFERVGWATLALAAAFAVLTLVVDLAAAALGAKRARATPWAVAGAAAGTVVGLAFGLLGVFLLPFLGAVAGEALARRDLLQAGRAGFATWLGLLVGGAVKLALVFAMIGLFAVAYFL